MRQKQKKYNHFSFFFLFVGLFFLGQTLAEAGQLSVEVRAEAAILLNADSKAVLYNKHAHERFYPASTTKIATALYALIKNGGGLKTKIIAENDSIVSVTEEAKKKSGYSLPSHWLVPGSTHIGIKRGEELTLEDLLYGLMLASGNDAANVIAQHIGGSVPLFMEQLNAYLQDLGCSNTHFMNPHGLYHPKHQTTAYDLALLMQEAIKHPKFCEISSSSRYTRPKTNKQESTTLVHGNKLIRKGKYHYPNTIAGKTGHLALAGNTFVVAARHEGRTLIAVLLKVKERDHLFEDAIHLFEAAFNEPRARKIILPAGTQNFELKVEGVDNTLKTFSTEDLSFEFYPSEEPKVKCFLYWNEINLPIEQGSFVGEVRLEIETGEVLKAVKLYSQEKLVGSWSWMIKNFLGFNNH